MSALVPAVEVRCDRCGAVLAATDGPDGLTVNFMLTVRFRKTMKLECKCGHEKPWSGAPVQKHLTIPGESE
jgi:hypothetical protein